ncbi:MAG: SDR family NAD(P)-dependent oxidoreductase [Pseudomonadota bacterium]
MSSVFAQAVTPEDGVAWVTGASGGIGRALCRKLAGLGWTVYATARRQEALDSLVAEDVGDIRPVRGDVTDLDRIRAIVAEVTAERPLALAVLNAGIYTPMRAQAFDAEAAKRMIDVNVTGVVNGLDPVLAHMIPNGKGHIAVMASVAGYRGLPDAAAYSASKAALIAMAEALAMDLVDLGVRISVINPGFVETEATSVNTFEMPFLMSPDEAADRIVTGLDRPGFEIVFPMRLALILKAIGFLPYRSYIWAVRRALGWSQV